ncbi:MAG: tetratricopeptide repeat protein [Candidatus Omnitrophota bacterium]
MLKKTLLIFTAIFFLCSALYAQPNSQEQEALYVAKKAYEDGFYEVALNLFGRFLKNYPASKKAPEANLYIAQSYFQQEKFILALTGLEKLSSDPAAKDLKDVVLYWIGEVHFRGKDFKKAASFYKKITDGFPQSKFLVHAYYSWGWCLFELGEFLSAIDIFEKIIDDFSRESLVQDAYFKKLECLYSLKDYHELKEDIFVFQEKYPQDETYADRIYFLLAESYFYLDDYKQAIKQYQAAIGNFGDRKITSLSQLGLVWCYLKLENYVDAQNLLTALKPEDLTNQEKEGLLLAKANLFTQTDNFEHALRVWSELQDIANEPPIIMQAYLGKAEALYDLGRYSEAISVYQGVQNIARDLPAELLDKLYYGLAWAFLKDGRFREAIIEFQKAASFASDEIIKIAALCQVGDTYQDAGDYQKAVEIYDQILKDYPDNFYVDYVQYKLGFACLRLSRYDQAILAFKTLLLNFSKSKLRAEAVYSLALALFQKQDYKGSFEAIKKYLPELRDNKLEVEALYLLATSLYNLGEFSEAIEAFKDVIQKADDIKIIQKAEYEIADCFYQLGDEKTAMNKFKKLRAKYPDSTLTSEVTLWLGGYYFRKGDLVLSRRYFSSIATDFPESGLLSDAYYALGLLDSEEGHLDTAIKNFQKVIEIGSNDIRTQASIAIADIFLKQEKFDQAEANYQEAIKNSPALAGLIYPKISLIYEKKGDFNQAIKFYHKAMPLISIKEAANLQFKIARTFERSGDYDQAVEEYLKIPYLYTADPRLVVKAYLNGAQIYENHNDFLKAKDIYLKVAAMDIEEAKYARERLLWIKENQQ